MSDRSRRWGIDLIGTLYAVASIFVLATFRDPSRIVMMCVIPTAVLLLILAVGLIARVGIAHVVMMGLLWLTLGLSVLFCLLYLSQIAGFVAEVPELEPKNSLARTVVRISIAWYTLSYLRREDVRAEFA